jgi:GT2 family glycosyltransferase
VTVAVITPWFGKPELWPDYQVAIDEARPDEILIVDNGSQPPLDFANVRLQTNKGFCAGSNVGLHMAVSDVIVFLNNDIGLRVRGWLDRILDALEPGVLVGSRLRTDRHAWVDGQPMPYLDGWCLAGYRTELLALGGFDETLAEPAYYSDNLLCLEARARGMTLREAAVGLYHKGGGTAAADPATVDATLANQVRYQERVRELHAWSAA